jgi:hypothetical protein
MHEKRASPRLNIRRVNLTVSKPPNGAPWPVTFYK